MNREPVLTNSIRFVLTEMVKYGGEFVVRLAHCYCAADLDNQKKLRCTFPKLFEKYDAMVPR